MSVVEMMKNIAGYNKTAFDYAFKSYVVLEGYTEKTAKNLMESNKIIADNPVALWEPVIKQCKESRNELKKTIDKNYETLVTLLD